MDTRSETGAVGLQPAELDALVGLARVLVGIDEDTSPEEADQLGLIAVEIGEETFWRHMEASYGRALDLDTVLELAGAIQRQEAREAIFALLESLAGADGIEPSETALLDRLRALWIG